MSRATTLTALREVAQVLAWREFGECRGYSDNLLPATEALRLARKVINDSRPCGAGIMDILKDGKWRTPKELMRALDGTKTTISRQLHALLCKDRITRRKQGKAYEYASTDPRAIALRQKPKIETVWRH